MTAEPTLITRDAAGRLIGGGRSLNAKGRLPGSHRVQTLARIYTKEALETLVEAMRNAPSIRDRVLAASAILDRGHGKPAMSISADVTAAASISINLPWLRGRDVAGNVIEHRNAPQISSD